MANEDGSLQLVFNGEIYNFLELRDLLEQKGPPFPQSGPIPRSSFTATKNGGTNASSTSGACLPLPSGTGASSIFVVLGTGWGLNPSIITTSRAVLPLPRKSKGLLAIPEIPRRVNSPGLYDYLGYEFVPSPQTMFEGISKLPPGHLPDFPTGAWRYKPYWDLRFSRGLVVPPRRRWRTCGPCYGKRCGMHLISDVPLGVFLSGGLDSSTLVALMRHLGVDPLRTFSIGYPDPSFSELPYARMVAERFETDHQVLMIPEVTIQDLEDAVWHLDEPMTDLSALPLYLVCREAKKHVTVCLSGEGGDEIFAGYDRFKASKFDHYYRRVPEWLREKVHLSGGETPARPAAKKRGHQYPETVYGRIPPAAGWRAPALAIFHFPGLGNGCSKTTFKARISTDPFRPSKACLERCPSDDRLDREIYLDLKFVMPDSVLMKVDKMSMAHALEIRVPFLDHRVVEFTTTLPGSWKLKGFETKAIFRQALKGWLPDTHCAPGQTGLQPAH